MNEVDLLNIYFDYINVKDFVVQDKLIVYDEYILDIDFFVFYIFLRDKIYYH